MPQVKKENWNGVHEELVDGELVLNFKSCLSRVVIIFDYLKLKLILIIKVWQTRSLAQSFLCCEIIALSWQTRFCILIMLSKKRFNLIGVSVYFNHVLLMLKTYKYPRIFSEYSRRAQYSAYLCCRRSYCWDILIQTCTLFCVSVFGGTQTLY